MFDNLLVEQFRAGDSVALDTLMCNYKPLVKAKAKTYFLIGGDLEDLIQEGMIGLYKAVLDFDPQKGVNFSTFASLCVVRQIQTAIKVAGRKKHQPLNTSISINNPPIEDGILDKMPASYTNNPESLFLGREAYKDIDYFIEHNLTNLEYNVLMLYMDGKSHAEIAIELSKNLKSIDNAIQRIRKKILVKIQEVDL